VASVLECLPQGGRIAIVRFRSLGDCVLTTPAIDILRRARPDVRIAIVVEDRFRALFEDNPDVDEILPPSIGTVRRWHPNLCVNFHGGTRSAWMSALSGAGQRAGFGHFRNQWVYNLRIPRAQEILGEERTVHTAEHLASAMFWLGAEAREIPRAKLVARDVVKRAIAVIHPVAATPDKTWPADRFLAVARRVKQLGLEPVFIGALSDDLSPFHDYFTAQGTSLTKVKSLLAGASLFIGNDSGPAHMAAAFGLPVVVIFGNSNPAIWGPWRTASEVITAPGGIAHVEVDQVLSALERLRVHA
jgi:heptosyltransferase III